MAVDNNPDYWLGDVYRDAFCERLADGIYPDKAIDLGDFGAGSDAAIILDYHEDESSPRVLGLDWGNIDGKRAWVTLGDTFDAFADLIGLP